MQQAMMLAQGAASGGGGSAVTWDASKKAANAMLSGGDLTVASSAGTSSALSTLGHTTGKRYFEVVCNATSGQTCIGIARAGGSTDLASDLGQEAGEYAWHGSGNSYFAGAFGARTGGAIATGTVVGIAVDFTNRRLWISINGAWVVGNPATGTTPAVTYATGLGTIFAGASVQVGDVVTGRFNSGFSYAIPSGFSAWGA